MVYLLLYKVYRQQTTTNYQCGDHICSLSCTSNGCYAAHILGIAEGTNWRQKLRMKGLGLSPQQQKGGTMN